MDFGATEQPRTSVDVAAASRSAASMTTTGDGTRGTSPPSRPATGPSRFGNSRVKHTAATQGSTSSEGEALTSAPVKGFAFTARLWQWAQKASWNAGPKGGRRLKDITLEHVLSGETCAPISLSDFENFLAHCDYSLENLQFVVWYLDYQARFNALSDEQRKLSPPPSRVEPQRFSTLPKDLSNIDPIKKKRKLSINTSALASSSGSSLAFTPPPASGTLPLPSLTPVTSNTSGAPPTPTSPAPAYSVSDPRLNFAVSSSRGPELDLQAFYAYAYNTSSFPPAGSTSNSGTSINLDSPPISPYLPSPTTSHPLVDSSQVQLPASSPRVRPPPQPPLPSSIDADAQPFRAEIQRVLATFVLPGSRKELLLDAEERDRAISEARWTTHPDVFAALHSTCMTHLRLVALPRFLINGATNVNRPKQVFWYIFGLLDIAIGLVLALLIILCPLDRWMVTPDRAPSHRAWRLIGLPLFWLGTMQWYAAYRGFCSQIFFRGTTQLRAWEMDTLEGEVRPSEELDDDREEDWLEQGGTRRKKNLARSSSLPNGTGRIAPFLDLETFSGSSNSREVSSSHPNRNDARSLISKDPTQKSVIGTTASQSKSGERSSRPNTARSRRRRPPVFGPERIVEDETIRAVHAQVWRDLLKFGAVWAILYVAVVVSVPSLRAGSYP